MAKRKKQILAEALKLPPTERAELIENLLSSFEFQPGKSIDVLWVKEAEDRIDAFESGKMASKPASDCSAVVNSLNARIMFLLRTCP